MRASSSLPLAVDAPARHRLGIFTTTELRNQGVTVAEVRSAVRTGAWIRLRSGVFVTREDLAEVDRTQRRPGLDALAVTTALARPGAALSHDTAGWVWGLPRSRDVASTVRLTDPFHWRSGRGWRMTRAALPDDEVAVRGAYRVTSAARTLIDLAREHSEVDAVAAVDAALLRRLTTKPELARVLARQATVPGIPRAVRAVSLADGRAESWLETLGRLRFAAAGLPAFIPQVELWTDGEYKVVDGWYPDAAFAIEFDGRVKYLQPAYGRSAGEEVWREKRLEDRLRSSGVRFARLAFADFGAPWQRWVERLAADLAVPAERRRAFQERPREHGRVRVAASVDDGWLTRADDLVGGP